MLIRFSQNACMAGYGLLAAQILVGIVLSVYYRPEMGEAHSSLMEMRKAGSLGFLIGFHYFAAACGLLLAASGLAAMLWTGQFRWNHRWLWWGAIALLTVTLLFQMTGNLLPTSQHDVRTANAEAQIASGAPIFGQALADFVLAGNQVTGDTLERWYFVHRFVAPPIAILFGLLTVLKSGGWPRGATVLLLGVGLLSATLAASIGAPIGLAATPHDMVSGATEPMWYVVPLHALYHLANQLSPGLGWLGALAVPVLLLAAGAIAPFLSKNKRPAALAFARLSVLAGVAFVLLSYLSYSDSIQDPLNEQRLEIPMPHSVPSQPPPDADLVERGRIAFSEVGCVKCHKVGGQGQGAMGPDLAGVGRKHPSREWMKEMLRDPAAKGFARMPPIKKATDEQLDSVIEYVMSLAHAEQ